MKVRTMEVAYVSLENQFHVHLYATQHKKCLPRLVISDLECC